MRRNCQLDPPRWGQVSTTPVRSGPLPLGSRYSGTRPGGTRGGDDAGTDRARRQRDDGPDGGATTEAQKAAVGVAMEAAARLVAAGHELVVPHGNGPQVGNLLVKNELAAT